MSQDAVLITGAAGFIGFALARRLLEAGRAVVGVDSINDYYDPALKKARLALLSEFDNFAFHKADLAERQAVESALARNKGNLTRAAADLEISRPSLYELIEKLGIPRR